MKWLYARLILISTLAVIVPQTSLSQSRVVYVNSYHQGYPWSDDIFRSIQKEFTGKKIDLTVIHLDSKRNPGKKFIREAASLAYNEILTIKPDIIIASDDNASRYLVMPYFKDSIYPVIFCGINWDADIYGYPYSNTTGMIEVSDIKKLIRTLELFSKGERIVHLAADVLTARKEGHYYNIILNRDIRNVFVSRFNDWVEAFKTLQKTYDIIIIGNRSGINDWNEQDALACVKAFTRRPTGTFYEFMCPFAIIGYVKDASEQGEWAARTALKVIEGARVSDIPMTKNQRFSMIVNQTIAATAGVTIPANIIKEADKILD